MAHWKFWRLACRNSLTALILLAAVLTVLVWAGFILTLPVIYHRYWFDGLAALSAALGMGILVMYRVGGRWRSFAGVVVAAVLLQSAAHAMVETASGTAIMRSNAQLNGFNAADHRNLAELTAIGLVQQGRFPPWCWWTSTPISICACCDLTAWIHATSICRPWTARLPALAPGPHLLIFARGTYEDNPDFIFLNWKDDWPPGLKQRFDQYQKRLLSLPVLRRFPGPPQDVLASKPINANDDLFVSMIGSN